VYSGFCTRCWLRVNVAGKSSAHAVKRQASEAHQKYHFPKILSCANQANFLPGQPLSLLVLVFLRVVLSLAFLSLLLGLFPLVWHSKSCLDYLVWLVIMLFSLANSFISVTLAFFCVGRLSRSCFSWLSSCFWRFASRFLSFSSKASRLRLLDSKAPLAVEIEARSPCLACRVSED